MEREDINKLGILWILLNIATEINEHEGIAEIMRVIKNKLYLEQNIDVVKSFWNTEFKIVDKNNHELFCWNIN